jgi:hypothetical protein
MRRLSFWRPTREFLQSDFLEKYGKTKGQLSGLHDVNSNAPWVRLRGNGPASNHGANERRLAGYRVRRIVRKDAETGGITGVEAEIAS